MIRSYCFEMARRAADLTVEVLGTDIMDCPGSCLRECNFANVRLPIDAAVVKAPERVQEWIRVTGVRESGIYYQVVYYRDVFYWRISGMIYLEEADYRKGAEVLNVLCVRVRANEHAPEDLASSDEAVGFGDDTSTEGSCPNTPTHD